MPEKLQAWYHCHNYTKKEIIAGANTDFNVYIICELIDRTNEHILQALECIDRVEKRLKYVPNNKIRK